MDMSINEVKDSDMFLEFLKKRNIKFALHGHKHIPKIQVHNDIHIIAAGSSTGSISHSQSGKTYLSYNVIKFDHEFLKPVSCTIFAEDTIGAGPSNVIVKVF
jgi:predicted phosphodiesterase